MTPEVPGFTHNADDISIEIVEDETNILNDQDQTSREPNQVDENMGAISHSLESLEDEPADFMRGEVDVKEAMDRAAREMNASIHGLADEDDDGSPEDTPGGLEEVEQKMYQDLATHKGFRP